MLKTSPSQTHAMTYTSSHPEVFYKKVFLKNSQENSCAGVSFFCKFHENEALVHVIFCELCEIFKNTFFTEHLRQLLLDLYSREPILTQVLMV